MFLVLLLDIKYPLAAFLFFLCSQRSHKGQFGALIVLLSVLYWYTANEMSRHISRFIPQGTVRRDIEYWEERSRQVSPNGSLSAGPRRRRHRSLPPKPPEPASPDLREGLRHAEPSGPHFKDTSWTPPPLRHISRRQTKFSSEIDERKAKRPVAKHSCGHYQQIATVGVPHGEDHPKTIADTGNGYIVVGPAFVAEKDKAPEDQLRVPQKCPTCHSNDITTELMKDINELLVSYRGEELARPESPVSETSSTTSEEVVEEKLPYTTAQIEELVDRAAWGLAMADAECGNFPSLGARVAAAERWVRWSTRRPL
ncbi:hypothetical protein BT63DRAFT_412414 [Microthyrium microscopicum]|uniref:Uncharacterized protein n=1 Tax=Microthyrium microscopicum TaxID=703497 RepID=A0A6A6UIS6_9PEZI|nr:hypothetical protein BT63DRAFT_412414 [Microthyrium microscopicum]